MVDGMHNCEVHSIRSVCVRDFVQVIASWPVIVKKLSNADCMALGKIVSESVLMTLEEKG